MQYRIDMKELIEVMRKVIIENHIKGLKRGHKKAMKDDREDGIKRKSQIEFDKKLVEIKSRISVLTEILQE